MDPKNFRIRRILDGDSDSDSHSDDIEVIYRPFGEDVIKLIRENVRGGRGMRALIDRLPLHPLEKKAVNPHDTVLLYIRRFGVASFLNLLRPEGKAATADPGETRATPASIAPPEGETLIRPRQPGKGTATPIDSNNETSIRPAPPGAKHPASSDAGGGTNKTSSGWDGVERRRSERRTKADRRQEVDIVYKNKRYGGDRRKNDRRKK